MESILPLNAYRRCPKCGSHQLRRVYYAATACLEHKCPGSAQGVEHHHRTCQACHYQWAEQVWDGQMATWPQPTCPHLTWDLVTIGSASYFQCRQCGELRWWLCAVPSSLAPGESMIVPWSAEQGSGR